MTMNVIQGLVFPMVVLPGVGHMPGPGEDEKVAARVFYVATTRVSQSLAIGVRSDGGAIGATEDVARPKLSQYGRRALR